MEGTSAGSSNAANGDERTKHLKTIYIGSLHEDTTEPLLCTLFAQFGTIKTCKLIKDGSSTGMFAFIDYDEHKSAEMAIQAMTGRVFLGRTIKVNWAVSSPPGGNTGATAAIGPGFNTVNHYAIFVGDISNELSDEELYDAFSKFGVISDCRIIRDPVTLKCRNYGFITYVGKEAAANAIKDMNGHWMGNRSIRTNWAHKKNGSPSSLVETAMTPPLDSAKPTYQQIDSQASSTNLTIYCGNVTSGLSKNLLTHIFSPFGAISNIRAFPEKRYGFVRFVERSSAIRAIMEMNEAIINGDSIRVSWGKEHLSSANDIAYWQSCQDFQNAYSMYMQQQSFYQANAVAQALQTYQSQFPGNWFQSQQVQGSGSSSFGMGNTFQAASDADNQRAKMQTEASTYFSTKNGA